MLSIAASDFIDLSTIVVLTYDRLDGRMVDTAVLLRGRILMLESIKLTQIAIVATLLVCLGQSRGNWFRLLVTVSRN